VDAKKRFVLRTSIREGEKVSLCDFLSRSSELSKGRVKDAMNKGAAWLQRKDGRQKRVRKATMMLNAGDRVEFYYDKRLLLMEPPRAVCVSDQSLYSVWYKPAGLMAQGTMYGDHCSIMRQAGLFFGPQHEVFLVHRLDREASGIMILAHSKEAASRLSVLFQKNLVEKKYRVEVLGKPPKTGRSRTIDFPLDGKPSITEYEVVS